MGLDMTFGKNNTEEHTIHTLLTELDLSSIPREVLVFSVFILDYKGKF